MNEINIGYNISVKRKEKGITQEELADFLGVSKASVSKWECNQSYPDVTLLPIIATYFDISVDELIGYHPQLSKNKIKEIYLRLVSDFGKKPFDEVYDECMDYGKRYYSCWKFQFYIGLLLVNHGKLAGDKCEEVYKEAENIFDRIIKNSKDLSLGRSSSYLKSASLLMRNDAEDGIFERLELVEEAPRSDELIKEDIKEIIVNNPVFKALENEERFNDLVKRLKEI